MERLEERNFSFPSLTFEPEETLPIPRRGAERPSRNHHDSIADDVVQLYLEEIRNIPLLTRAEEQEIFSRMEEGKKAKRKGKS